MPRLLKLFTVLIISAAVSSCRTKQNTFTSERADSIKHVLQMLPNVSLDFENLYATIANTDLTSTVQRESGGFLYDLDKRDTIQFDHSDYLIPLGKIFENETIVSIIFRDYYDYKDAIHIFNFTKPSLTPVSSFILFSIGGDGEDFWHTNGRSIDALSFQVTQTIGRYDEIATQDTTFVRQRQTWVISVDPIQAVATRRLLSTESNFKITK